MTEGSRGEGSQKEEIMAFEHISVLLYETVDGLNVPRFASTVPFRFNMLQRTSFGYFGSGVMAVSAT